MKYILIIISFYQTFQKTKKQVPQAQNLNNHFGTNTKLNTYGPGATIQIDKIEYKDHYGHFQNLLSDKAQLLKDMYGPCEMGNQKYDFCTAYSDCGICATDPLCGWCGSTQKCLPKDEATCECSCRCPKQWFYDYKQCKSEYFVYGAATNVAPEATTLIPAEINGLKDPHIQKRTQHIQEFQPETVQELLGYVPERDIVEWHDKPKNHLKTKEAIVSKPVLAMVTKPIWHDEKITTQYHRLTNELIPNEMPQYHGSDYGENNKRSAAVYNNHMQITAPQ